MCPWSSDVSSWCKNSGRRLFVSMGLSLLTVRVWASGGGLAIVMNWAHPAPMSSDKWPLRAGMRSWVRFQSCCPLTFPEKPSPGPTLLWVLICCIGWQSVGSGQEMFYSRLKIKARMHAGGFGCQRWISVSSHKVWSHPIYFLPSPSPQSHPVFLRLLLFLIKYHHLSAPTSPGLSEIPCLSFLKLKLHVQLFFLHLFTYSFVQQTAGRDYLLTGKTSTEIEKQPKTKIIS